MKRMCATSGGSSFAPTCAAVTAWPSLLLAQPVMATTHASAPNAAYFEKALISTSTSVRSDTSSVCRGAVENVWRGVEPVLRENPETFGPAPDDLNGFSTGVEYIEPVP